MSKTATKIFGQVGRRGLELAEQSREVGRLARETFYWMLIAPFRGKGFKWKYVVEQMVKIGYESLPIVSLIAFFVGLIIAMQSAYQLKAFGATIYTANLTAVSIIRELGPLLTAIIITGRNGSAITAEIGTMRVSEEIDALATMGLNPVKFLVVPRVLAMMIMLPCLTVIADLVGIFGGYLISVFYFHMSPTTYFDPMPIYMNNFDLLTGVVKAVIFGIIIVTISCYKGLTTRGGAEGVGRSTTNSVVICYTFILFTNFLITLGLNLLQNATGWFK